MKLFTLLAVLAAITLTSEARAYDITNPQVAADINELRLEGFRITYGFTDAEDLPEASDEGRYMLASAATVGTPVAMAQALAQGDADAPQEGGTPASDEPAPTSGELVNEAKGVYDTWVTLGALAGLAALLNLLMNMLKFGPVKEWFEVNKKKWMLVYISVGLGAIAGGLGAYAMGVNVVEGILGGIMAGAMASGSHEFLTKLRPTKRTA